MRISLEDDVMHAPAGRARVRTVHAVLLVAAIELGLWLIALAAAAAIARAGWPILAAGVALASLVILAAAFSAGPLTRNAGESCILEPRRRRRPCRPGL